MTAIEAMIAAIVPGTSVGELDYARTGFTDVTVAELAANLPHAQKLQRLNLDHNAITEVGAIALAAGITPLTNLNRLHLDGNAIGDAGAIALAEALRGKDMQTLSVQGCSIGPKGLAALAEVMAEQPNLLYFNATRNEWGRDDDLSIVEPFFKAGHTSLMTTITGHPALQEMADENKAIAKDLVAKVGGSIGQIRQVYFDASHRMTALIGMARQSPNNPNIIAGITSHMDREFAGHAWNSTWSALETISDPETLFTALTENNSGNTPLSNPKVWEKFPEITEKLAAAGKPLTKAHLMRQFKSSPTYLELGTRGGYLSDIMDVIHAEGERLGYDELLDADNKPTAILQAAIDARDVGPLFRAENWVGATTRDLQKVYDVLPVTEKPQVPMHTLGIQLKRDERTLARMERN